MADLRVNLCGKTLASPVIAASGTFGFGVEYENIVDLKKLGAVSGKGLTLEGKYGNEGERLWETPSGLINSIGLQNPGVQHFIDNELPDMLGMGCAAMANLGGSTIETYEEGARLLDKTAIDFIELNISCPNVKAGGIAYGVKAESAREVVSRVRKCTTKPMIVKLSPNAENIVEMALACEEAGADGLSLVNTFQAMAIDLEKRRPVFHNVFAGLSGPAIRPIALRMVYQVCGAVKVPVVGLGGIATAHDALEFILAGATAVQVGTANFMDPKACEKIVDGIGEWMDAHGVKTLDEIRGAARV
ncbi:dihydroorotate dehydrogenase [uncultured Ruthenibacterium sp.]|uniref:dihydroorotate dehydrogenase n=1 Tax=uncultured Ruthenibacterium sp. TaxID=1905347 RepID=UPI00349E841D